MPELPAIVAELTSVAARCVDAARSGAATAVDDLLLDQQRQLAAAARLVDLAASTLAAEIAHRSRRELGYAGLAQKRGARTPEALVQEITGASSATARRLVRVGTLIAETAAHDDDSSSAVTEPWLAPAVRAAVAGAISMEAVDAIRLGLGTPSDSVLPDALAHAAHQLTVEAAEVSLERLAARARELRDELDLAGVAMREEERRERRSLRLFPQLDGMTRITGLLDPESAAVLTNAIDTATSPRRGGPRFVSEHDVARAERIVNDPRSTEQLALDALVELVDVAMRARVDGSVPTRRPDVRVLVTQADLDKRSGVGHLEGQHSAVSIPTVERYICDGGLTPILFDDQGQALNLGRSRRLHNGAQRTVIAARDGGCLAPDCERPASWCEVHHTNEFSKGGKTSVEDGVLLCRHHHMLVHNNGWRIDRVGGHYWLIPPPTIDAKQRPILLRTKSAAVRRMLSTARRVPELTHA